MVKNGLRVPVSKTYVAAVLKTVLRLAFMRLSHLRIGVLTG